ncbi:bifunctional phosphopantothenoylcysteine decarboxylase/phosphopantothenate--cysteine ligase CoaBC [Pseudidiomarina andamanensis]|uniref:Coenzyme A biosynthesis bifunctional protein CoaBC n=1 Tax=Pseudidiomarina andamanensis TaxID=1940690 RepID=A0AA92EV91_9GAMM|nr:bifunctional phosphopantothenoylcysteine decarboxylase/phosphopantothenate--cysteine ligase CoaBC [Pseudidiomarina andamanensis]MDS0219093.1 bifunctional phosphopantothenoylcysteine decarboxylase/phosphopantothenate--cysteine ligase CoaBC [Pseudidiomarina andamanensis]QGT96441.1 bifunctional phosphopantothenoylcysteine decarboxylase/phosphopantothenate--cysteine ligase CoaBC [Pseudidiomarina andamanensis]
MSTSPNQPLLGRRILLGISGGIAAYKTPELVRRLKDYGADVRCVLTQGGQAFITPLTLQAVSGNPVHHDLLDPAAEAAMGHIELAKWAELVFIAPASANTLAQLAHGHASDLLTTLCLATAAPVAVAPAMNQQMWAHAAVQANCDLLRQRGVNVITPASGAQACGDVGAGRMPEPLELRDVICSLLLPHNQELTGKHIVITAGPTREAIDPVRYLSNHSSGKMGFALAAAAQAMGAQVTLIAGPVNIATPTGVKRIDVVSAEQMHTAAMQAVENADVFIGCAAVADYRPEQVADSKIKKSNDGMQITLVRNPDILADVAALAKAPFTIGFAAETNDVAHYAQDKLARKKLNMIAANDVSDTSIGFNSEDNAMLLFWRDTNNTVQQQALARASKLTIAQQILQQAAKLLSNNQ